MRNGFDRISPGRHERTADVPKIAVLDFSLQNGVIGNFVTNLPKCRASSTGRCNTGLKFTRRGFKAQGLSRALI
jgi:hypothetical protein